MQRDGSVTAVDWWRRKWEKKTMGKVVVVEEKGVHERGKA